MEPSDPRRSQLLARVAELGSRYGLNPGDYVVDVRLGEGPDGSMALAVASNPTDPAKATLFRLMVATLGVSAATGVRVDRFSNLNDAFDYALRIRDALDGAERPTRRG